MEDEWTETLTTEKCLIHLLKKHPERLQGGQGQSVCVSMCECECVCVECVSLQVRVGGSWSFTFDDEGDVAAQLVFTLCYRELCLKTQTNTLMCLTHKTSPDRQVRDKQTGERQTDRWETDRKMRDRPTGERQTDRWETNRKMRDRQTGERQTDRWETNRKMRDRQVRNRPESAVLRCEWPSVCAASQRRFESETFPSPMPWRWWAEEEEEVRGRWGRGCDPTAFTSDYRLKTSCYIQCGDRGTRPQCSLMVLIPTSPHTPPLQLSL